MVKDSSAIYYQNHEERLPKNARERYQSLSKEKKRCYNVGVKNTKNYQKMKNKSLLSIEKKIIKQGKEPFYKYKMF